MLAKSKRTTLRLVAAVVGVVAATTAVCQSLVNTGPIDPSTWVRGPLYAAPANPVIWSPVKALRLAGKEWALNTQSSYSLTGYCTTAAKAATTNATGNAFSGTSVATPATWTEMQHSANDWEEVWAMWGQACALNSIPGGNVPGSRLSTLLKRDIQKALDGGAMLLVVPTVDSVEEAEDIQDLIYYPPIGHRHYGPSQAEGMYASVPGGYRATFNANFTLVFMIETILGSQAANDTGALPNIDGLFGATSDLGNFSGYLSGDTDYEQLITNAYNAAHSHGEGSCTAFGFRGRVTSAGFPAPYANFAYKFDCYQN